jgi:hypothetical protein
MSHIKVNEENSLLGVVEFIAKILYNTYEACCECNHPSGNCSQNNAHTNCYNCMHQIHFDYPDQLRINYYRPEQLRICPKQLRMDYDCQKLIYYYACRYSWKYCSEIMYALDQVGLKNFDNLSVLSIGCGSSPDLMALEFLNSKLNKNIDYVGCDVNSLWSGIHHIIKNYFKNPLYSSKITCNFLADNLLDNHSKLGDKNVIIVSYLISSLYYHYNYSQLESLKILILDHIKTFNSTSRLLILFNDVDIQYVNDFYKYFIIKFQSDSTSYKASIYHFTVTKWKSVDDYVVNEKNHECNNNKFDIPQDFKDNFDCPIDCTSVQCIIEVFKKSK